MTQMRKTRKMQGMQKNIAQMTSFLQNRKKLELEIFVFCVITFEPINI